MGVFDQNNAPPPSSGGGIRGRLIGALIIAIFGFIMYISQMEKNPVTGEKQHVAITPDQEIRLGLESAPEMSHEMGGELPANDPRTQEVKEIGAFLAAHTDASGSPWKFQFHLLADPKTVNAFALPGGQIFITLGLLNRLQTEAQLAGVLGHEMGHVIERHTAQQMAKSQLGKLLVVAVGTGVSNPNGPNTYDPTAIAALVNEMFQLHYSRKDESQADTWGIKLTSEAGFDPRAMIEVMKILKEASGSGGQTLEIFQTHPNPDLRIKQIQAYLAEHPPSSGLKEGRNLKDIFGRRQTSE